MLEQDIVAKLHELAYGQHIAVAAGREEDAFEQEIERAHERYHQAAGAMAPWLQVRAERTVAEVWADLQERRKDPTHMAWVAREQKLLDDRAKKYKEAVEKELQIYKEARDWEKERRARLRNRNNGRLSTRTSRRR